MYRTETSSIFATMSKGLCVAIVLAVFSGHVWAQGASGIPNIAEVIEGVGTVISATVPIYTEADKNSKVLQYAVPTQKVTIIGTNDEWYCVRLYSGRQGYIEKRNLKTVKVFYDESVTTNSMDKRLNVELYDLVDRFNEVLQNSVYVRKYQSVPKLGIQNTVRRNDTITVTLEYYAVDANGNIIPSRKDNDLHGEMKDFIELMFMKMLSAMADSYVIVIRKPVFSSTGQVVSTQGEYAEIKLEHAAVDMAAIKDRKDRLLSALECSLKMEDLFTDFPN